MEERYPVEILSEDIDDGTMPENVANLAKEVVGHRIVRAERVERVHKSPYSSYTYTAECFEIELDNGKIVQLTDGGDCCAYTQVESFLLAVNDVEHVITGIGTTDEYTTWHIFADLGDILELKVGWSCGNPFYYGYGFNIAVVDADEVKAVEA